MVFFFYFNIKCLVKMLFFWVILRNRMEFFFGFLSFWWGKLNSVENLVLVDFMWIIIDDLFERKNCFVYFFRIYEGLIKRRFFYF